MSNFICKYCGKIIFDSEVGYVTGCTHYPIEDLQKICKLCKYNENGHCLKGKDDLRYNSFSDIHIYGCEDFEQ